MVAADWYQLRQKVKMFSGSTDTESSNYYIGRNELTKHFFFPKQQANSLYFFKTCFYSHQQLMNTFGISLFQSPEHFIALYLGMNSQTELFLQHLEKLLHRTKSPPLALTYTYHFLKDKSEEEVSLDVIRFVSQLADLSSGVSMASSLQGILGESSFLTELRHNLTHKTMVKGSILSLARRLILKELDEKYWQITLEKMKQTYRIQVSLVQSYYQTIFGCRLSEDLSWLKEVHSLSFYQECSNYQYKEHIASAIEEFKSGKLKKQQFSMYFTSVSHQKQVIFSVVLIQQYMKKADVDHFSHFVLNFVQNISTDICENQLVRRQFKRAFFFKYLGHAGKLFASLNENCQKEIKNFWDEKEKEIGKIY